jgi:hypothetical protein
MTPEECRVRARECEEFAATALTPQTRDAMLEVAAMWRRLAASDDSLVPESLVDRSSLAQDESVPESGSVSRAVKKEN